MPDRTKVRKRLTTFGMTLISVLVLLTGCASQLKWGSLPKIDGLKSLRVGVSTVSEIRETLGEPRGYGGLHHTADPTPWIRSYTEASADRIGLKAPVDPTYRKIWFYEYAEATELNLYEYRIGLNFLLIFFLDDRYDGHLWFSATNLLEAKR